jgi:hypothetical protein
MPTIRRALRKQPDLKAPQLTTLLRAEGYQGSVDLVRRRLARVRGEQGSAPHGGPLPGGDLQFDWAEMPTRPLIGGVRRRVFALVASLPFSGAQTAYFSYDATLEAFLEGHVRIFNWLGGVPNDCLYDHLPSFVVKRDSRGALRWGRRFRELRSHYEFRSTAYVREAYAQAGETASVGDMVASPSGDSIEGAVARLERSFWPGLLFGGLGELDALHATWRDGSAQAGRGAVGGLLVAKRLVEERAALSALPAGDFDYSLRRSVMVPRDGYVRHGASFYRVPSGLVNQRVELHASRDEIWVLTGGLRVAGYARSYRPGKWLPTRPQ